MQTLPADDPLSVAVVQAIEEGATERLSELLRDHSGLATVRLVGDDAPAMRTLLLVATDWPGHFPNVAETIRLLVEAGADPNATIKVDGGETPLHWAASSDDVAAVGALLDAEADLDAPGAVIAGGDPLQNAIGFQNYAAARRLVEGGARTVLGDEAALGLLDRMRARFEGDSVPGAGSVTYSFWNACCAGQREAAEYLLGKGADLNWVPGWCDDSPLDGARANGHTEVVAWLESLGGVSNRDAG